MPAIGGVHSRISDMQRVAIPIAFFLAASSVVAAGLDAAIENCNGCHGDRGVSRWTDVPTIAGLSEFYHSEQLYVYRDGDRACEDSPYRQGDTTRAETNMCAVARGLDDDEIEAIAAHYAELAFVAAKQEFDASLVAEGKVIHDRDCSRCHADGGSNPDDDAGILAGQWMGYLEYAFREYAAEDREQIAKMKEKMDALDDAGTRALLHYYASQQ